MDAEPLTDLTALGFVPACVPKRWQPDANGWVPHGRCVAYRPNGGLLCEITYDQGVAHGPYRAYGSDGRLCSEGQYADGVQDGEWWFDCVERTEVLLFRAGREVVDWDAFFGHKGPWSNPPVERPASEAPRE